VNNENFLISYNTISFFVFLQKTPNYQQSIQHRNILTTTMLFTFSPPKILSLSGKKLPRAFGEIMQQFYSRMTNSLWILGWSNAARFFMGILNLRKKWSSLIVVASNAKLSGEQYNFLKTPPRNDLLNFLKPREGQETTWNQDSSVKVIRNCVKRKVTLSKTI